MAALLLGFLAPLAALATPVEPALANGVPQLVKLTYLEGISNHGPREAEGVLEFSFAEAYARVDVKNLVPEAGMVYEGWLVGPDSTPYRVGEIAIAPSGLGWLETKLQALNTYDYNLFVVTLRSAAESPAPMPAQKSIAGQFAVISASAQGPAADSRPAVLPDTGEPAPGGPIPRIGFAALAMLGSAVAILAVRRAYSRCSWAHGRGR